MRTLDQTEMQLASGGRHWPFPGILPRLPVIPPPPDGPGSPRCQPPVPLPYPWCPPMPISL